MYAVIQTGGKQYRVSPGDILQIERIQGEAGEKKELSEVLLIGDEGQVKVGTPVVEGATVSIEILGQERGKKLTIFKKLRRKGKQLKKGHRQELTRVRVDDISN